MKRLIVNADDFGRTPGVNEGTLEAHRNGIVTSATVMVLEPAAEEGIRAALAQNPSLSLGLHFVITGGGPPASRVLDLLELAPGGHFPRLPEELPHHLPAGEIRRELKAQIALFEKIAGRLPSHLDSHHHSALHSSVQRVFAQVAEELGLPVRASDERAREELRLAGAITPDFFLDSFYAEGATAENLRALIENLQEGTSELMCHPGYADEALLSGSSYAEERERELPILCDPAIRSLIKERGVSLIGFDQL